MDYRGLKEDRKHEDGSLPIRCYRYICPPGGIPMHCHWHAELEFFLLEQGEASVQCGNRFFTPKPGSLLFFGSGELHSAAAERQEEIRLRSVVFHPDFLSDGGLIRAKYINPLLTGKLRIPPMPAHGEDLLSDFNALFDALERKEPGYEFLVKSLLSHMFYLLSPQFLPTDSEGRDLSSESVKLVMEYIQKNFESRLTTDSLASVCNMSRGHFCRTFKKYTARTPVEYINSVRISRAMELLSSTDMKILDVALETGFHSQSYFIEVFRENTGLSPAAFRKSL